MYGYTNLGDNNLFDKLIIAYIDWKLLLIGRLGMRVRFVQPLIMPERTRNVPVLSSFSPTTH